MNKPKILFVCSRNKWRSPTAEKIYWNHNKISVRSAGLSSKGNHQINEKDISWADLIIFMENWHKSKLIAQYRGTVRIPKTEVLNIPDEFKYMDDEMIEIMKPQIDFLIKKYFKIHSLTKKYLKNQIHRCFIKKLYKLRMMYMSIKSLNFYENVKRIDNNCCNG